MYIYLKDTKIHIDTYEDKKMHRYLVSYIYIDR